MAHLITAQNELHGLHDLLGLILHKGAANGNYLELLDCLLTIPFAQSSWQRYCRFKDEFLKVGGEIARIGWEKVTRVYTNESDRHTKPSYLGRLIAYPDRPRNAKGVSPGLNQINKITTELAKKPGYSNLSFVFLRPADLHDQVRPGYVPCAIAGDFKFRDGQFHMNVMFRTSDAFAVAYGDVYYLRQLQIKVLTQAQNQTAHIALRDGRVGNLTLYFCRSYIERSRKVRMKGRSSSKRVKIIPLAEALISRIESY
ncbi:MAG: hypothetical protein ACETWD_03930 [Desulfatiglandales bacterium]